MKAFYGNSENSEFGSRAALTYPADMRRLHAFTPSVPLATALIALTAILFGLVPLFARALQAEGVGSATIALSRYAFTMLVVWPFLPLARETRREGLLLGAAGLFMGVGWIAWLEAVKVAPVAAAGVVYMTYPLFAVLFGWALLGARPGPRSLAAASLAVAAAALLLDPAAAAETRLSALLWALPAPITFGFIVVALSAMTPSLRPLERMASGMGGAVLGLAPLALGVEGAALAAADPAVWGLFLGLGGATALLPQFLFTVAAPQVGPARAASAGALELPTMIAVGWLAFGEAIGPRETLAALLVISGVFLAPAIRPAAARPTAA